MKRVSDSRSIFSIKLFQHNRIFEETSVGTLISDIKGTQRDLKGEKRTFSANYVPSFLLSTNALMNYSGNFITSRGVKRKTMNPIIMKARDIDRATSASLLRRYTLRATSYGTSKLRYEIPASFIAERSVFALCGCSVYASPGGTYRLLRLF